MESCDGIYREFGVLFPGAHGDGGAVLLVGGGRAEVVHVPPCAQPHPTPPPTKTLTPALAPKPRLKGWTVPEISLGVLRGVNGSDQFRSF